LTYDAPGDSTTFERLAIQRYAEFGKADRGAESEEMNELHLDWRKLKRRRYV
jgi:hypothetical protein